MTSNDTLGDILRAASIVVLRCNHGCRPTAREGAETNLVDRRFHDRAAALGSYTTMCRRKMKIRSRHILAAAIWMLAAVTASGSGVALDAGVACIGVDDHVDVESLLDSCCIVVDSGIRGRGLTSVPANSCGDCVDVQLRDSSFKSKRSFLSPPVDDDGCVLCALCCNGGREARSADAINRMDQHSRSLSPLSTVILLT